MINFIILYYSAASIFIIFIAIKIIPDGIAWIALTDYLDSYRDYCYLSCTKEPKTFCIFSCSSEELSNKKDKVIHLLKEIGQKDKVITNPESAIFDSLFGIQSTTVFKHCLLINSWKNIHIGWEFITMLEQAIIAYENRLKEKLSLLFWIDYFKLLYQNIKTLIKRRLTTP